MHTTLDCIPCFLRQALAAARAFSQDALLHERVVRDILRQVSAMQMDQPPPVMSQIIHRKLRQLTGVADPYREAKRRFNRLAEDLLPALRAELEQSPDPLIGAASLAIAANVIDLGPRSDLGDEEARQALRAASQVPTRGDWAGFRAAVERAERILYLADNAGEIAIDRLLIEQIGPERVTLAVRGAPVINDATLEDARELGLTAFVATIDNGSDAPGTILDECSQTFRDHFASADLIISKGQGNFETLSGSPRNIFYLLKIKCPVVADHTGLPTGAHAVLASRDQAAE